MKEFNKFFIATLKRVAQNVNPLVTKKNKILTDIENLKYELDAIELQLDAYEEPIRQATGGFTTEDLISKVVELTDKYDKNNRPIKVTKYVLKYPETIIPVVNNLVSSELANDSENSIEENIQ